jgi:hypothetical protein
MEDETWRTTEADFRRKYVAASKRFDDADSTYVISETANSTTFDASLLNERADAAEEMAQILKAWNAAAFSQYAMNGR